MIRNCSSVVGRAAPFANFVARFEDVQSQIDKITENLLGHEHKLLKDIKSLDLLYGKTLNFYDELALYIAAGEAKDPQRTFPRAIALGPRGSRARSAP